MKKIIEIPYYSQLKDVKDGAWQRKACGVTCLKMVGDFLRPGNLPEIDGLIKEGVFIKGYGENGWIHDALVILAHNYGLNAYKQEFRSCEINLAKNEVKNSVFADEIFNAGIQKIISHIEDNKPVIVSVDRSFGETLSSHVVVLVGYEEGEGMESFYYNDPNGEENTHKQKIVSIADFKSHWRKLAIFFE